MSRRIVGIEVAIVASLLLGGCVTRRAVPVPTVPAARYAPPADRYVRSVLLDFESPSDLAFIEGAGATLASDPTTSGNTVLRAGGATIKLGALLRGRTFPGPWDLIGLRVLAAGATKVSATLGDADAAHYEAGTTLPSNAWQTIWLETAPFAATRPTSAPADELTLTLQADGDVFVDDVALVQGRTVVADSIAPAGARFLVERKGLGWRAMLGDRELATLPAAPFIADGYRVIEANAARVVLTNSVGYSTCVDRAGRTINTFADGSGAPAPPASVGAIDGDARLVRNAPGDHDNDGYDETRGCFTIRAAGDRFTVHLEPIAAGGDGATSQPSCSCVVFDIDGLRADGVASVWVQGEVIGETTRTTSASGATRTIVELPLRVERPIDVSVRVR